MAFVSFGRSQDSGLSGFVGKGGGSLNVHDSGESFQSRCQEAVRTMQYIVAQRSESRSYIIRFLMDKNDKENQCGRLRIARDSNVTGVRGAVECKGNLGKLNQRTAWKRVGRDQ